ncbi:hypothetical protein SDC9_197350 [bioreactor metagenome]|uniref:Uncharacterized protein n=1 Tax=bioreactor metagenome TaxID=1076179 RepID=A0A645IEI1_9ZZZZ
MGDREIVIGENTKEDNGLKYMTSFCQSNEIFRSYSDALCSDDYTEIAGIYGKRIAERSEKVRNEIKNIGVETTPLTATDCLPLSHKDDINDKVIALKSEIMRPEYRRADCQIYLVTGGFGASANSRGSAVFCKNLYTGKDTRWERRDVLGVIKPESLPGWAKQREEEIRTEKKRPKEKDSPGVR